MAAINRTKVSWIERIMSRFLIDRPIEVCLRLATFQHKPERGRVSHLVKPSTDPTRWSGRSIADGNRSFLILILIVILILIFIASAAVTDNSTPLSTHVAPLRREFESWCVGCEPRSACF